MSITQRTYDHCPVEVTGDDGYAEPCGHPVTGWAWHDDHAFCEPMLMSACDRHVTDGAQGIADVVAENAALRAKVARVEALAEGPTSVGYQPYAVAIDGEVHLAVLLDDLRAVLEGGSDGQ